jgi:D-alanine transaminase
MPRIAYVNGAYLPFASASVHIEDRGYQFADGVYEVVPVGKGRLLNDGRHLARLRRSLAELRIAPPLSDGALRLVIGEILKRNRVTDGLVYIQVTRGVARRDHAFPARPVKPAIVVLARALDMAKMEALRASGIAVVTVPDQRWARCDIKSTSLLANVLAKQAAREQGAYEAWLVDGAGLIREGASTTAWIVTESGVVVTRQLDEHILPGCTRDTLLDAARAHQIRIEERPFSVEEAKSAGEAFITAASFGVLPVTTIDGTRLGKGKPGSVAQRLHRIYWESLLTPVASE